MLTDKEVKLVKIRMVILDMNQYDLAKHIGVGTAQQLGYTLNQHRNSPSIEKRLRDFIEPLKNVDIWGL